MKNTWIPRTLIVAALALLLACQKETEKEPVQRIDVSFAEDHALAEGEVNSVSNFTEEQVNSSPGKTATSILWQLPNGVTGTLDLSASPKLSINFGTTGVLCNDGRTRKGWVYMDWTDNYLDSGTVITTTTHNYYVNNNLHRLRRVVTNQGLNAALNPTYRVAEWDTVVLDDAAGTLYWQSDRTREWAEGHDTPLNIYDDLYNVRGTASGLTRAGRSYEIETVGAIGLRPDCRYIYSGVLDVHPQDAQTIRIDYGNGCPLLKTARVSVAGFSVDVPLN